MGRHKKTEAGGIRKTNRGKGGAVRRGFDGSNVPSMRKTVSIFQQPVTLVVTTSRDTKKATTEQLKKGISANAAKNAKPYQLFYPKVFENLRASVPIDNFMSVATGNVRCFTEKMELPSKVVSAVPEILNEEGTTASLCAAIHSTLQKPVEGQTLPHDKLIKHPEYLLTLDQPLIEKIEITQQDIYDQEEKVLEKRKILKEAYKQNIPFDNKKEVFEGWLL
uniref:MBD_C domain-containing protein n=1 Tax=Strongyloides venezuelensis TaxID=75913 RepID=A0A0K0G041_STRVS